MYRRSYVGDVRRVGVRAWSRFSFDERCARPVEPRLLLDPREALLLLDDPRLADDRFEFELDRLRDDDDDPRALPLELPRDRFDALLLLWLLEDRLRPVDLLDRLPEEALFERLLRELFEALLFERLLPERFEALLFERLLPERFEALLFDRLELPDRLEALLLRLPLDDFFALLPRDFPASIESSISRFDESPEMPACP